MTVRRTVVLAVVLACAALFAGVGAAAHEEPRRSILGIELDADGDAVVYYVQTHDLENDDQRERYESFADNETRRAKHREWIVAELEAAAAAGRNATALDMRVHNGSVRTYEQDGFGRLEVRVEWENLAFADEGRVVVTEPFRSGYAPESSRVGIHAPDGYRRGATQPQPLRARADSALWNPRTSDLSEFYAEFVGLDAGEGGTDGSDENGDGGGGEDGSVGTFFRALLVALAPVVAVLLALRRRQ